MDSRTWKAAEARRQPVVVEFPDGRAFAFPSGVPARRVLNLKDDLSASPATLVADVEGVDMMLRALVPASLEEAESRMGTEIVAAVTADYDLLLDSLVWEDLRQLAGFLYRTYVLGIEPADLQDLEEETTDSPPVLTPSQPPA